MADPGETAMFESEEFEIVDECVDEDEAAPVKGCSESLLAKCTDETKSADNQKSVNDKDLKNMTIEKLTSANNTEKNKKNSNDENKKETPKSTNILQNRNIPNEERYLNNRQGNSRYRKPIDFTADISLEQFNAPGEYMTDEEIMNHLDEIENIVLDGTSFELQDETDQSNSILNTSEADTSEADKVEPVEKVSTKIEVEPPEEVKSTTGEKDTNEKEKENEVIVIKENENTSTTETETKTSDMDWYEKKLEAKVATVKDRLSKLARVLEFSYPRYKGWLDRNEATTGTPVCRLEKPRQCSLEKPHTNRWKFMCNKKPVQESTEKQNMNKEENSGNTNSTMWRLTPTGVWDSNTDNSSEYPPFVMKAVKVFEDFLQTPSSPDELPLQSSSETIVKSNETSKPEESSVNSEIDDKENVKQQWLWLLVRCNRADELMLFATGRNISRATMDSLKQVYEVGPGKDCKVKSLYCKSIIKNGGTTNTTTTFLVGSEALDEIVGGIKIQLAPKTNFWSNAAGAESLGNAVADLLSPTPKTTVVEIGCGTGLIGLMLSSKCHQVIGLDSPSEVEEAEMTSELNGVKNASFVMGEPSEVMATIAAVLSNCKAAAIVNTNTNIGRAIEVMTDLRKILSLKRLVMVTTLTKQSVRSILELTRPGDHSLGNPFIPIRACVVDTLPIGPHFEVVILMERRVISKFPKYWINPSNPRTAPKAISLGNKGASTSNVQGANNLSKKEKLNNKSSKMNELVGRKNVDKLEPVPKKGKFVQSAQKKAQFAASKQPKDIPPAPRNKFKMKRAHSPEKTHVPPKKVANKFERGNLKPWAVNRDFPESKPNEYKRTQNKFADAGRKDFEYRHRNPVIKDRLDRDKSHAWNDESLVHHRSPSHDKRFRDQKDQSDLRERLSGNRIEPEIMEKVKKQQQMLDMAKQKLSGPSATVDVATAKHLQSMLNMVLEQTNKLQSQLPRSVWDRIAPPENPPAPLNLQSENDPLLKGRYVQGMGAQDIVITTANREFLKPNESMTRGNYDRFNCVSPSRHSLLPSSSRQDSGLDRFQNVIPERYHSHDVDYHKQKQEQQSEWNREKQSDKNRWKPFQQMKKDSPPIRKQISPPRHYTSTVGRPISPRRVLSPHKRPLSPPRRQISPQKRHMSPLRRQISPSRHHISPSRRQLSPLRRQTSPPRRQLSPLRRQISPRHQLSPARRQISPLREAGSSHRHMISPSRHQLSPPRRIADEWDIPSRGAIEENTWQRSSERIPEKRWHEDRQPSSTSNWDHPISNDRYRKTVNQDKWDIKDASHDAIWTSAGSGDTWEPKQSTTVPNKEHWQSSSDNRWPSSMGGSNGDNWNIRGKESFTKPMARGEEPKAVWADNAKPRWGDSMGSTKDSWGQADKEDWNDLPDDAKDPWGDDGNNVVKDRWPKYDNNSGPSSAWSRDNQAMDTWAKPGDSWQSKSNSGNKPQWQSSATGQPMNDPRWSSSDGMKKNLISSGWQGNTGPTNNWQSQNYPAFQQTRSYNQGSFKDRR